MRFGCIADDFTGASDIASFFVKGGLSTVLYNGVPNDDEAPQAEV
ncbi:four-carbon acid sugar kinase family protein, partial [Neobacillus drentensis]